MTTEAAPRVEITLPPLHPSQRIIAKDPHRFKVVCCGRRWGKTLLAMTLCLRGGLNKQRIWHVAPTYKQTLEGWAYLLRIVHQLPKDIVRVHTAELQVTFAGGGSIQLRTADNPDNLRGSGLDGVVLDEAATMKQDAWDLVLRPALADKQGWALFISTPQHFNWFYEIFNRGESGAEDWQSWQLPTWDNPFIPEAEIEAAQRDMLPEDFDQEFGASFTAVGGAVFRLLSAERRFYLRPMPKDLDWLRRGVGMDWGTTKQHQAAVVSGGVTKTGAVWITSSWLSESGSSDEWRAEARRCQTSHGARFARIDRSQASEIDRLKQVGFLDVDKGKADVEGRIGDAQGLVIKRAIFFDINGPGMAELYAHACAYHRDRDGKIVEEEDDDVDAWLYLTAALVLPGSGPNVRRIGVDYRPRDVPTETRTPDARVRV